MNHDIAHCKGDNCPRKETCHRYVAHLELVTRPTGVPNIYHTYVHVPDAADCKVFWSLGEPEE